MISLKSFLSLATATALSLAAPAFADSITFTLSNPTQTIAPGQTVTFNATVTAVAGNSGAVYLNSDAVNIADAASAFTIDDSDFLANFPYFLNPAGPGSTFTGDLFSVTNTGSVNEAYTGSFTLFGGADGGAGDSIGTVTFGSPMATAVTPEPSSLVLLSTGFVGLVSMGKRRLFL